MCSMSSQRTPVWPQTRKFIQMRMAPRTQDSGILVEVTGSRSTRAFYCLVVADVTATFSGCQYPEPEEAFGSRQNGVCMSAQL